MPTVTTTRASAIPSVRASTVIPTVRNGTTSDEALVDGVVDCGIVQPPAKGRPKRATEKKACESGGPEEVGGVEVGAEEIEPAVDDTAEDPEFVHQPKRQKKTPQKRKPKATPSGESPAKKKPPSRRKRLAIESSDSGLVPAAGAADADASAPRSAGKKVRALVEPRAPKGIGKPRGRRRAESPEDGETQEIAVNVVKMKDLCRDIRIGKKSKRFFELQQMDSTKLAKEQEENVEKERRIAAGEAEGGEHETTEERLERLANERGKRT